MHSNKSMYFQEFDNLNKAYLKLKTELIPNVNIQMATLYEISSTLGEEEQNQGLLSIISCKLKNDVDAMLRMIDHILLPLIEKIIEDPSNTKIQSFDMLRMYHQRCIASTSELRSMCNNYITESNWSVTKRKTCLNLFDAEKSLLLYINFMENSIFPLLMPFTKSYDLIK